MTETARPRRPLARRRVTWVMVAVLAALVVGGTVATRIAFRYAHAPALDCACGLAWAAPDNTRVTETEAGGHQAMNVPADPSRRQRFHVQIINRSSVTQTVLGDAHAAADGQTIYAGVLAVAPSTSNS